MLKDDIPLLVDYIESCKGRLQSSRELLEIYENDLLKYIEAMFKSEMGAQTYEEIKTRIPPINILIKILDKLSQIYQGGVTREVIDGSENDQGLIDWYVESFDADMKFNQGNEFMNLDRINLMQPYFDEDEGKPALRAAPNDRFLVYSNNNLNPLSETHVMMDMGKRLKIKQDRRKKNLLSVDVWVVWTKDEIIAFDMDGELRLDVMAEFEMDGTNPYGVLPFAYANSSQNFLVPPTDSDTKRMTVLIPALLADLNYACKFQCFSQIFVYNAEKETWTIAPNSVHFLNDKPGSDTQARVEVVKPDVDITEIIQMTVTQLTMWLNSRSIKSGTVGDLSAANLASGVSKIIDEMDTTKIREKQAKIYARVEAKFWDRVLNHMHPVWVEQGLVTNRHIFTPSAKVMITFEDQAPKTDRSSLVDISIKEISSGLKSRQTVMRELNPEWSDERIQMELDLIDGVDDGLAENQDSN